MFVVNPAHLVKSIHLYPGSGEYIYEIKPILSEGAAINSHNNKNIPDVIVSLDQLKETMPNLEYISIMVDWFATSLNAGQAKIIPKVESNDKDIEWQVSHYTRKTAHEMNSYSNGEITYGGTPTDRSIVELCSYLKDQGYKIMLFPVIMVDDETLTKPWRGFIKPMSKKSTWENSINQFFKGEEGYNNFILHYAKLEYNGVKLKEIIDSFVIGSELKELTSSKVNAYLYPAIINLKELAALAKEELGGRVKLTYSANWGEYHSPYMDQLWCDNNIDFVGISAYFPLTDNLAQNQITFDEIKNGWISGEGVDFYRDGSTKIDFNDQAWAWKNVKYWWNSFHPENTCWTPKQKPVIFTEYGFSSTDETSNHPYLYYDANSNSNLPNANNEAQSLAIAASETFFLESNKQDPDFLPLCFLYGWDARPYPDFPNNCNYWSDCNQHPYSHSVNGKIGTIMIDIPKELDHTEF